NPTYGTEEVQFQQIDEYNPNPQPVPEVIEAPTQELAVDVTPSVGAFVSQKWFLFVVSGPCDDFYVVLPTYRKRSLTPDALIVTT
ncbi:hypothetical protein KIN20_020480, partial [Parelaphostrongylus tenuis]